MRLRKVLVYTLTSNSPCRLSLQGTDAGVCISPMRVRILECTAMNPNRLDIIHGYRHLYRSLLQAVMYSRPNRFIARDQLRRAFREPGAQWDAEGVKRTVWFFKAAAKERGLEHRIVKNLLRTHGQRTKDDRRWSAALHKSRTEYVVLTLLRLLYPELPGPCLLSLDVFSSFFPFFPYLFFFVWGGRGGFLYSCESLWLSLCSADGMMQVG